MIRDFHHVFAWVVVGANALAGVWALVAHWVEAARHRSLWWFTALAEFTVFVQVIAGVAALGDLEPADYQFHMFYGFVALVTVGLIYSYRDQMAQYRYLLYGLGGLFLMGLALRAISLGPRV